MVKGIIYNPNVEDPAKEQSGYMERLWEFNQLKPSEGDKKVKYMKETFAEVTIVSGVTIGEHDREYFYRADKTDPEPPTQIGTNFENIKFL